MLLSRLLNELRISPVFGCPNVVARLHRRKLARWYRGMSHVAPTDASDIMQRFTEPALAVLDKGKPLDASDLESADWMLKAATVGWNLVVMEELGILQGPFASRDLGDALGLLECLLPLVERFIQHKHEEFAGHLWMVHRLRVELDEAGRFLVHTEPWR